MRISEMIDKLKEIKEKEGDLPIYYPDTDLGFEINNDFIDLREEKYYSNGEIEYPKRVLIQ